MVDGEERKVTGRWQEAIGGLGRVESCRLPEREAAERGMHLGSSTGVS